MIISCSHSIAPALRCNGTPLEQVREHTVNGDLMEGKITSLLLNNESFEEVAQFKYVGVTITDDLSWSKQVSSVVSKARRILGMIYRKFYCFRGTSTMLRLHKAYVKPHLNHCSSEWDPPLVKDQEALESVQKFALKLCCKNWSAAYLQLLDSTGLTTLSAERKIAKLCFLYKTVNNLTSFPANIISCCCCCSRPHVTSSFSALTGLMQLKIDCKKNSMALHHQYSTTTCIDPTLRISTT